MCFRFREGLPEEAAYLKQPTRSLQDSSRDPKIDHTDVVIFRLGCP